MSNVWAFFFKSINVIDNYDYLCLAMYYIVPLDRSVWEIMAIIVLESLIFSDNFLTHGPSLSEHERKSVAMQ